MGWRGWLVFLAVGLVAGWLAGKIAWGRGFGLFGNIAVGVVGAFVGGFLGTHLLGIMPVSLLGYLIMSTVGAILLLIVIRIIF